MLKLWQWNKLIFRGMSTRVVVFRVQCLGEGWSVCLTEGGCRLTEEGYRLTEEGYWLSPHGGGLFVLWVSWVVKVVCLRRGYLPPKRVWGGDVYSQINCFWGFWRADMFFNLGRLYLELSYLLKGGSEFDKKWYLNEDKMYCVSEDVQNIWGATPLVGGRDWRFLESPRSIAHFQISEEVKIRLKSFFYMPLWTNKMLTKANKMLTKAN